MSASPSEDRHSGKVRKLAARSLEPSPLNANGSADASGRGSDLYASNRGKPRGNADSDDGSADVHA